MIIDQVFSGALGTLRSGSEYRMLPPRGPPEHLPALTEEDLEALQQTAYGQDLNLQTYAYQRIEPIEDDLRPRRISLPGRDETAGVRLYGVDGSNQRLEYASFYLILSRAALVAFKYSSSPARPYTRTTKEDLAGVVLVDGNAFSDELNLYVRVPSGGVSDSFDLLPIIQTGGDRPLLVRYDPEKADKNPGSHALGWAVKFQQALELSLLGDVPLNTPGICIRDGPLFSTSISPAETIHGLNPIFQWHDQVLLSVSKRVAESTLLLETLIHKPDLRDYWFPNQELTDNTLKSISTDSIILPRILHPGERTPLIQAVPRARRKVVDQEPRLAPLTCYYLSRTRPHRFIRMEVPRFMWERDSRQVEWAIRLVAWQQELGKRAPLVQLQADDRCQLTSELEKLRWRTTAALHEKNLDLPEVYL